MTGKILSRCPSCGKDIGLKMYTDAGRYMVIHQNGRFQEMWFCSWDCLWDNLRNHLMQHGKIKCYEKKRFGQEKAIAQSIITLTITQIK